jgi:hypothetical protein
MGGIEGGAAIVGVDVVMFALCYPGSQSCCRRNAQCRMVRWRRCTDKLMQRHPSRRQLLPTTYTRPVRSTLHQPPPLAVPLPSFTTIANPQLTFAMASSLPDEVVTCLQNARFVSPFQRHSSHSRLIFPSLKSLSTSCLIPACSCFPSFGRPISPRHTQSSLVSCVMCLLCKHVLRLHNTPSVSPLRTCLVLTDLNSSILQHAQTTFLMSH